MTNAKRHVVVTTGRERRGVFGGEYVKGDVGGTVVLRDVRMAVYWSGDVHGVVGLAAHGPTATCKISPAAPVIELDGVTAIMDMSPAAKIAWDSEPWG